MRASLRLPFVSAFTILCINSILRADDWPQWMGPNRDGVYAETGLVDSIPESGLKELWR
ncbi:MAG: pyrrolo-quinoline quinone, partial [Planctomycetota bacterium]